MFNFIKAGRSPGILARLAAFRKLFTPERSTNAALRHYAWRYYMKHYRSRFCFKISDYIVQLVIGGAIIYAGYKRAFVRNFTEDQIIIFVVYVLMFMALMAIIHAIIGIFHRSADAAKFADDVLLSAETKDDVVEFFRENYPFAFFDP